jgi:septal ring factor EnvC (AmiA/AmiB activator)
MKLPAEAKKSISMTIVEGKDLSQSIAISNTNDDTIRFFMNNTISSPEVKQALQKALEFKAALVKVQQDLANVNQQLKVITDDQGRLRANLREMPQTAAAYKRYLEKFDKQETEIEDLQKQQKSLQTRELEAHQALDGYLTSLNVK